MTIRQTIPAPKLGEEQLPNGYPGSDQPSSFTIPSCGIEDVDVALFRLFDTELGFASQKLTNGANGPVNIKKPTVVFATGERFAIVKRLRPVRDRNGALMLPAISIRRRSIIQSDEDMNSRGINQTTGELVIRRRLDASDRDYQNLINKSLLQNAGLPTSTRREVGANRNDPSVQQGMLLDPKLGNNVFEIITIPQPQFLTITYEVVFWTSFTQHMTYLIETMLMSQLPQGRMFRLDTDKGYWFIANIDDDFESQENFDDFAEKERIVRYSFTVSVKCFLLSSNGPGRTCPFTRYISATNLSFELVESSPPANRAQVEQQTGVTADRFVLNDLQQSRNMEQQPTTLDRLAFERKVTDPNTGRTRSEYVYVADRNTKKGETVYTASSPAVLDEFLFGTSGRK